MRLERKRALVTGGGRGIGRAIALAFAGEGADVAVAARTRAEIEGVKAEIEARGRRGLALPCDVGAPGEVERAVAAVEEAWGGVDILVANAGLLRHAPLEGTSDALWDEVLRVNLTSVFRAVRAVLPGMVERGWGRVIAMSSVSGKVGGANRSAYHAAKHGVIGLVRSAALEVAQRGVTVNAICPGFVETRMISDNRDDFIRFGGNDGGEDVLRKFREEIPMKRFLDPSEVAAMAAFLASEDARGVTGEAYTISCGAVQA
ncbi:MAG: SDR family oxidoreductase [Candidatus Tectomicrobia bacterium]|uniref:SDR family oxidoreductase n=1 Tax=Tectimicrobiota bacterium TaxID=2528274 RepID=A0A932MPG7_UNCTE|nr:SDR family oxidoreductase [Candidatus Tectomicrobia bacterium]